MIFAIIVWIRIRFILGTWIRIIKNQDRDPHQSDQSDPDPHQRDTDPQYCFAIVVCIVTDTSSCRRTAAPRWRLPNPGAATPARAAAAATPSRAATAAATPSRAAAAAAASLR